MTEPGDSKQSPYVGFVWFHGKDEEAQMVHISEIAYPSRMAIFFIFRGIRSSHSLRHGISGASKYITLRPPK